MVAGSDIAASVASEADSPDAQHSAGGFASLVWRVGRLGKGARVFFPNGYGASIVIGPTTYGGDRGLYELAVLVGDENRFHLAYDTPITDDVCGHLTENDVSDLLAQIAALPARAEGRS